MPYGDRTGPMGQGPMTGRRAGFCAGYGMPGYANSSPNRGRGRGFGWGRGRGFVGGQSWAGYSPRWTAPTPTREQEVDLLKSQARELQDALQRINDRLEALEKEA